MSSPKSKRSETTVPKTPPASKKGGGAKSPRKSYSKHPMTPKVKGGNSVDTYATKVEEVLVHTFTKHDKAEGSYTNPMKKEWEDDTLVMSNEWGIHGWFPRRGKEGMAMPVKSGSDFDWEVAISLTYLLEDQATPMSVGANIAKKFSQYAKESPEIKGTQPYQFHRAVEADPKPLNHYLLDKDVAKILRKIYEDSSKEELVASPDVMVAFFGTVAWGEHYLGQLNDEIWEHLKD